MRTILSDIVMEFPTEDEAYEYAEERGYEISKTLDGTGGIYNKACIAWMTTRLRRTSL